jgi:site-specific DNA-methyltransferase (adenine-specific)
MMQPYYQDSLVTIYHGDCRELLPTLPRADVVFMDPPYGINKAAWDAEFPVWALDLCVQSAKATVGITPGTWNLAGLPKMVRDMTYKWTLSAHLTNGMTRGGLGFGNWIPLVVYSRQQTREEVVIWCMRFADWCDSQRITRGQLDAVAGTSDMGGWWMGRLAHRCQVPAPHQWEKIRTHFSPPEYFNALVRPSDYEPRGDCRAFVVGREVKPNHESPKPLNVLTWFLSCLPGATTLDPFCGSGTTLRAAKDLERRAVGIEIEERYCEIAAERCRQEVLELGA